MPKAEASSVWGRALAESLPDVSSAEIGKLLALRLAKRDADRMRELGELAQESNLSDPERAELGELVSIS